MKSGLGSSSGHGSGEGGGPVQPKAVYLTLRNRAKLARWGVVL